MSHFTLSRVTPPNCITAAQTNRQNISHVLGNSAITIPDTIKKGHISIHTLPNVNYTHSPNRINVDTMPARSWLYAECQYFMKKQFKGDSQSQKAALAYIKYTERQKNRWFTQNQC